ncbi:MAG: hypothetical protein DRR19_06340 [Candidatus Parabeggiatoa sp. nov. 1]|nr:MAG: hypothetical protein DRR19_06340 [Gammaproteobacteria bacterium]
MIFVACPLNLGEIEKRIYQGRDFQNFGLLYFLESKIDERKWYIFSQKSPYMVGNKNPRWATF